MVIYTVLPADVVLNRSEERHFVELSVGDTVVTVEPVGSGKGRVIRVCSTDPQNYLLRGLQPGDFVPLRGEIAPAEGLSKERPYPFFTD